MARNLTDAGWRRVELLDTVDSTNAHALRDPCAWQIVVAHEQVAGRGRLDRRWQVPAGLGVTMSMTVPLPRADARSSDASSRSDGPSGADASSGEAPSAWGWVPLFAGEAVRAALAGLVDADADETDVEVGLKWPNDVVVRSRVVRSGEDGDDASWSKLGGLLCQVVPAPLWTSPPSNPSQGGVGEAERLVVIGVGLNVAQERRDLPDAAPGITPATSLRLQGIELARDDVVLAVAENVRSAALRWADPGNLDAMRAAVRRHCVTLGALVDVHEPSGAVRRCRVVELDDDGRIVTEEHVTEQSETGRDSRSALSEAPRRVAYSVADVVHARLNGGSGS